MHLYKIVRSSLLKIVDVTKGKNSEIKQTVGKKMWQESIRSGEKKNVFLYTILRWENCSRDSKLQCMNAICLFISLNGRMEDMLGKLMFAARNLFTQSGTDRWKPAVNEKWMFHTYIRAPFKLPQCYHARRRVCPYTVPCSTGHQCYLAQKTNYRTTWILKWANPLILCRLEMLSIIESVIKTRSLKIYV